LQPRGRRSTEKRSRHGDEIFLVFFFFWCAGGVVVVLQSNSNDNNTKGKLNLWVILTICICAFVASKIFIGTLCYWRWKRQHRICEIKLSGKYCIFSMYKFSLRSVHTKKSHATGDKLHHTRRIIHWL
jgi:hypothetical protein